MPTPRLQVRTPLALRRAHSTPRDLARGTIGLIGRWKDCLAKGHPIFRSDKPALNWELFNTSGDTIVPEVLARLRAKVESFLADRFMSNMRCVKNVEKAENWKKVLDSRVGANDPRLVKDFGKNLRAALPDPPETIVKGDVMDFYFTDFGLAGWEYEMIKQYTKAKAHGVCLGSAASGSQTSGAAQDPAKGCVVPGSGASGSQSLSTEGGTSCHEALENQFLHWHGTNVYGWSSTLASNMVAASENHLHKQAANKHCPWETACGRGTYSTKNWRKARQYSDPWISTERKISAEKNTSPFVYPGCVKITLLCRIPGMAKGAEELAVWMKNTQQASAPARRKHRNQLIEAARETLADEKNPDVREQKACLQMLIHTASTQAMSHMSHVLMPWSDFEISLGRDPVVLEAPDYSDPREEILSRMAQVEINDKCGVRGRLKPSDRPVKEAGQEHGEKAWTNIDQYLAEDQSSHASVVGFVVTYGSASTKGATAKKAQFCIADFDEKLEVPYARPPGRW